MYCSHFGLQRLPFNNTPDPTFYYSTPDHEEALATLQYATQQRKGFVLVTGEIGAGKTLIGRIFLRQIDANSTTAVISQTNLTGRQLLAAICTEFGLAAPPEASTLDLTQRLQDFLVEQFARNRYVVVLLDEAQNLPDESFEELRMLGNLEADDAKLLQVCILGQPELRDRFRQPGMKQLDQRLFRRFHLPSLSRQQASEYIMHRLAVAACKDPQLFSPEAIERIYQGSGGVPRLINQICDNALLTAYGQERTRVDQRIIDLVLERDQSLVAPLAASLPPVSRERALARPTPTFHVADSLAGEAGRLAELAIEQTQTLHEEVSALESAPDGLNERVGKIAERQNELQKIVSGATMRWLSAKDKLEEYRGEIQAEIREVIVRCHKTQERLQNLEQTAAPAEDLEEIREMHMRETQRLIKLMQSQRDGLTEQLHEAEQRWSASDQELRRLVSQSRNDEQVRKVQEECESATRDVMDTLERHRQGMLDSINGLRQQCDVAHRQLQDAESNFERRCADGDRRVEQLRSDWSRNHQELSKLRDEIDTWRAGVRSDLRKVQERLTDPALADQFMKMQETQGAVVEALSRRCDAQEASLQTFRRGLEESMAQADRLHRGRVEQFVSQAAQLESGLKEIRGQLQTDHHALQVRVEQLGHQLRQVADSSVTPEQLQKVAGTKATVEQLERVAETRATVEQLQHVAKTRATVEQLQRVADSRVTPEQLQKVADSRVTPEQLQQVAETRATVEQLESVAQTRVTAEQVQKLTQSHVTREQLDTVRAEQTRVLKTILRQLNQRRQAMQEQCDAISDHCRRLQDGVDHLGTEKAEAADVETLRMQYEEQARLLSESTAEYQLELAKLAERANHHAQEMTQRLEALSQIAAHKDEVDALRSQLESQSEKLAAAVAGCRQEAAQTKTAIQSRMDETAARIAKLSEELATRHELEVVQKAQVRLADQLETVREMSARSDAQLGQRIGEEKQEREEAVAQLSGQVSSLGETLQEVAREKAPVETVERVEQTLTAKVGDLQDQMESATAQHTTSLQQLVAKLSDAAERVTELEKDESRYQVALQPDILPSLGLLVKTAEQERTGLTEAVERAGAISSHFKNCSSHLQEIMQEWLSSAGGVRQQSEGLRGSAESAKGILEAMLRCNAALDAKLKSSQWHAEIERGEALVARIDQSTATAGAVAQRLTSLLSEFEATRAELQAWELRMKRAEESAERLTRLAAGTQSAVAQTRQANEAAERLTRLINQAQSTGSRFEKAVDSRHRLIAALAQNTSNLADVIHKARTEDETFQPTSVPGQKRGEPAKSGAGKSGIRFDWSALHTAVNGK